MKTIIYYGLERKTIKEMTAKAPWLTEEIKKTKELAIKNNGDVTTVLETNKAAISIKVIL